jgi:hypothetical protein
MKKIVGSSVVILLIAAIIWVGWKFQPWMPAGRAVRVRTEHLGDCDFEVWQRKNAGRTEPFATGLFARTENGRWKAFLLDFEDTYRPSISFRKTELGVEIFRGSTRLGVFDETQQTYRRDLDGASFSGALLDAEPPNSWWVKQAKN